MSDQTPDPPPPPDDAEARRESSEPLAPPAEEQPERVVCPATKDSSIRLIIIAVILAGVSIWCVYDWSEYPKPEQPFSSETINDWAGHIFNHYLPYVAAPVIVLLVFLAVRSLKRVLVADPEGIGYEGKEKIPWSKVKRIDAGLLADKGILDLHHEDGRLRLDKVKLENFRPLVAYVESHVPEDVERKT